FFACAKKPGAKKAHPAFAPDAAHRVRGAGGIFREGILPSRKTPHPCAAPCGSCPPAPPLRRGPEGQGQQQQQPQEQTRCGSGFSRELLTPSLRRQGRVGEGALGSARTVATPSQP